jgi:hypothetical protein
LECDEPEEGQAGERKANDEAAHCRSEAALGEGASKHAKGANDDTKNEKQHGIILRGI